MRNLLLAIVALLAAIPTPSFCQDTLASSAQSDSSRLFASVGTASAVPGLHARDLRYRLRKGDSFDLDFQLSPEFNQTLVVGPDGFVTLREAGSLHAEGQTIPELTENVTTAYAKILHNPVISVGLKDFDKPYFIASGEVTKPGKYDLRGPLTVTQAVAIAGGFNENAKHSQVVLFRPTQDGVFEAKLVNVKKLLASRNLSEDVFLEPGDMLYVPKSAYSKIRPFIPTASMGAFYNPALF
jgi:polysaccharide export outer membrane protein